MMSMRYLDAENVKFLAEEFGVSETTLRRVNKSRNFDEYRELVAYDCRNNAKNREKIIKDKVCDEKDVEITKLQLDKLALEHKLEMADELIFKQSNVVKHLPIQAIEKHQTCSTIAILATASIILNLVASFAKVFGL